MMKYFKRLILMVLLFCLGISRGYSNTVFSMDKWGKNTLIRVYNGSSSDGEWLHLNIAEQLIAELGSDSIAVYIDLGYISTITLTDTLPDYLISVDTISFYVLKDTMIHGELRQEPVNGMHKKRKAICIYTALNELDFTNVIKLVYYGLLHVNEIRSTQKEMNIDPLGANAMLHTIDTNTISQVLATNPPELNKLLKRKYYLYPTPFSYNFQNVDLNEVSVACYYAYPQFIIYKPNRKSKINGKLWPWDNSEADTTGKIIAAFSSIGGILTISENKQIIYAGKNSYYFIEGEKIHGPYYLELTDFYYNSYYLKDFEDLGNTTRLTVWSHESKAIYAYYNKSMHRIVSVDSAFFAYYDAQKAMREKHEKMYGPKPPKKSFKITGALILIGSLFTATLIAGVINRKAA